jgi:hypothetical protein
MAETIKAVVWDMGGVLLKEIDPRPRQELSQEFQVPLNKLYEPVFQSESARRRPRAIARRSLTMDLSHLV